MTYSYIPKIVAESAVEDQMIAAMRTVIDPEIPVNIYDLGLVYEAVVDDNSVATIVMTLTAPSCPVAGQLVEGVQKAVNDVPGIDAVVVRLVFDPPWDSSRLSEEACLELGLL